MTTIYLEELQYLERETAHAKEDILRRADEFRKARDEYKISKENKDIDRLIYKLNFSRALTSILISQVQPRTLDEAANLMDMSRKLAKPRNKEFYEKRSKKKINQTMESLQ